MADERSRLRSYSITAACLHAWGAGSAQRTRGKSLDLPPSPEASPPPGRTAARSRPRWEPGYFPRSFTTSKKAPGREGNISRRAHSGVSQRGPCGLAGARRASGGEAPCSHGEGCGCIPAHLPPAPGGLFRAAPAPAAAPTPPPATPTKVGPGAPRPLLGGSGCERTRLLSAGEGPSPPPPPAPSFHSAGQPSPASSRRSPLSPSALPAPSSPRAGLAGEGPLRLFPLPAAGCGRESSEGRSSAARAPSRPPAPTARAAPDTKGSRCSRRPGRPSRRTAPAARLRPAPWRWLQAGKALSTMVSLSCQDVRVVKPPVASHTRPGSHAPSSTKSLKEMGQWLGSFTQCSSAGVRPWDRLADSPQLRRKQ
nr:mucin-1-like [Taeniopygia guttata]